MTLDVTIRFTSSLSHRSLFSICQKAVNTPEGTDPLLFYDGQYLTNPPDIGADCLMGVFAEGSEYEVSLDIPYIAAGEMHGIAQRVLNSLGVTEFQSYNEFDDTWHSDLDWLKSDSKI